MNRPIEVGAVLDEVFAIYRENFGVLIPTAFWINLVPAVVSGIAADGGNVGLAFLGSVVSLVAAVLYEGMVVSLVRDLQDGSRDLGVMELIGSVAPVLGALVGASLLYGLGVGIGLVLLIVPGCFLLTIWAVIAPAIVIEKRGAIESFGRSRELVRGHGWPVFGTVIAATLIGVIAALVLGVIAGAIAGGPILRIVFTALASTLTAPIGGLVAGVLYYRLVGVKEAPASVAPADAVV